MTKLKLETLGGWLDRIVPDVTRLFFWATIAVGLFYTSAVIYFLL